jgi:hypothetical protein
MTFRIAKPATVPAIIVITAGAGRSATARGHAAIVIVVPAAAGTTRTATLFPTAARGFGMTFRITEPTALAAIVVITARAGRSATARGHAAIVIVVPVAAGTTRTATLFPAATGRLGMTFRIAKPTALAAIVVITARARRHSTTAGGHAAIVVVPAAAGTALTATFLPTATSRLGMAAGISRPTTAAATIVTVIVIAGRTGRIR